MSDSGQPLFEIKQAVSFDCLFYFMKRLYFGTPSLFILIFIFIPVFFAAGAMIGFGPSYGLMGGLKYILVYILVLSVISAVSFFLSRNKTACSIFPDRAEGFRYTWNKNKESSVMLKDISVVVMKQGLLQKLFNTGTVDLYDEPNDDERVPNTAMGEDANSVYFDKPVISMDSIKNPGKVYGKIKELIGGYGAKMAVSDMADAGESQYHAKGTEILKVRPVFTPFTFFSGNVYFFMPAALAGMLGFIIFYMVSNAGRDIPMFYSVPAVLGASLLYGTVTRFPAYFLAVFRLYKDAAESERGVFTRVKKTFFLKHARHAPELTSDFAQKPFKLSNITFRDGGIAAFQLYDIVDGENKHKAISAIIQPYINKQTN